jgi:hypothetical protein
LYKKDIKKSPATNLISYEDIDQGVKCPQRFTCPKEERLISGFGVVLKKFDSAKYSKDIIVS